MYAIAFDLYTDRLANHYHGNAPTNAYDDIRRVLNNFGFERQQGSVYFGSASVATPVTCVLAVQELCRLHPWFKAVVKDIRMLRIEEDNDLMPAVGPLTLNFDAP
jgi:virulence-associated protein VapD